MRTVAFLAVLLVSTVGKVAAQNVDPTRYAFVATLDPLGEPVTGVAYLEQNWSPDQSAILFHLAGVADLAVRLVPRAGTA